MIKEENNEKMDKNGFYYQKEKIFFNTVIGSQHNRQPHGCRMIKIHVSPI